MDPPPSSDPDSDKSLELSCPDSLPPSGSSSDEADPKRQKVEGGEKNADSDGSGDMEEGNHDEEDSSGEIEDSDDYEDEDDDDDDAMEVKQWSPKVRTLIKSIPEDDEGLQRYIRKIKESECFDLDENPPLEYQMFATAIYKVDFDCPEDNHHVENIWRCLNHVIDEKKKQGILLEKVRIQTVNYGFDTGYNYYITFEAKKKLSAEEEEDKVYQAEVHHSIWKDINIHVFREKQQQQPLIQA
ncbi:unnamed protein product [Linum tenue]|uniref:Cystatin domain-containing protein n=1 Tax=Linum tenue TaxID=586396 RepID=A0AAV0P828_9ROSI|nr:unnamed protein product [Linum tenue]